MKRRKGKFYELNAAREIHKRERKRERGKKKKELEEKR